MPGTLPFRLLAHVSLAIFVMAELSLAFAQAPGDPPRRRRQMPGGAAAPFYGLPSEGLPFAPPPPPGLGDLPPPGPIQPPPGLGGLPSLSAPALNPALPPRGTERANVILEARFGKGAALVKQGLHWRIFNNVPEANGTFALIAESRDGMALFTLRPGTYIANVTYGYVTQSRRLIVGPEQKREEFALDAGGLRLIGQVSGKTLPMQSLTIDVYSGGVFDGGEQKAVLRQIHAGDILILPEGTYHVVSTFGDANATVRADIKVRAGRLTDATLNHRAATVNLRLVNAQGATTVANTTWSVLTPGGDVIKESIGSVPSIVLAEGEYLALARHEGRVYNHKFKVEPGNDLNLDIVARP